MGVCFYMAYYPIWCLPSGHVFITPEDDCDRLVDTLIKTEYGEEFCVASDFDEGFIGRLMVSGFLVMSTELRDDTESTREDKTNAGEKLRFILLPKLHLIRSVLFFHKLRVKKSARRFLPLYELRVNTDFEFILDKCVEIHGADWLTPPLVAVLKSMRRTADAAVSTGGEVAVFGEIAGEAAAEGAPCVRDLPREQIAPRLFSFAVYRERKIRAGEIGVVVGRVYTSYSGYYEEDNAGTVQMLLMIQWLKESGFDFLDLGMPLDYKTALGAEDIDPQSFVELFRAARE